MFLHFQASAGGAWQPIATFAPPSVTRAYEYKSSCRSADSERPTHIQVMLKKLQRAKNGFHFNI
jgi:hypothetical protein